jgi:hypothetical protein
MFDIDAVAAGHADDGRFDDLSGQVGCSFRAGRGRSCRRVKPNALFSPTNRSTDIDEAWIVSELRNTTV